VLAAAMLALAARGEVARSSPGPAFSVVLVVLDDVAAADLALYGGPVSTPNIEALAGAGVRFDDAYASPTCSPTRRMIQTGHWWATGNGEGCSDGIEPNTPLASEVFLPEAMPLHSSAIFGKWHLGVGPITGQALCAAIEDGYQFHLQGIRGNVQACNGTSYMSWDRVTGRVSPPTCAEVRSLVYEPRALRDSFISGFPSAPQPSLTVVCCNLAHSPFHVPPPDMLPIGYPPPTTQRQRFEAMIVAYDRMLAAMLGLVDLQTTVVIVVGDNGTPPQVAPDPGKAKATSFERGVRVPLVVCGGPVLQGVVSGELVHAVDLWSTIIELGGYSLPTGLPFPTASVSLVPILDGLAHAPPHDMVLCGAKWGEPEGDVGVVARSGATAVGHQLKLRRLDDDGDKSFDREELYDLALDPSELVNRILDSSYLADAASMRSWSDSAVLP
jgi:arylsulfatase A-like enzyme